MKHYVTGDLARNYKQAKSMCVIQREDPITISAEWLYCTGKMIQNIPSFNLHTYLMDFCVLANFSNAENCVKLR